LASTPPRSHPTDTHFFFTGLESLYSRFILWHCSAVLFETVSPLFSFMRPSSVLVLAGTVGRPANKKPIPSSSRIDIFFFFRFFRPDPREGMYQKWCLFPLHFFPYLCRKLSIPITSPPAFLMRRPRTFIRPFPFSPFYGPFPVLLYPVHLFNYPLNDFFTIFDFRGSLFFPPPLSFFASNLTNGLGFRMPPLLVYLVIGWVPFFHLSVPSVGRSFSFSVSMVLSSPCRGRLLLATPTTSLSFLFSLPFFSRY